MGKLLIVEGIDGVGKSTAVDTLTRMMEGLGYPTIHRWNDIGRRPSAKEHNSFRDVNFGEHVMLRRLLPELDKVVVADRLHLSEFAYDPATGLSDYERSWCPSWETDLVGDPSIDVLLLYITVRETPRKYFDGLPNDRRTRWESFAQFEKVLQKMNYAYLASVLPKSTIPSIARREEPSNSTRFVRDLLTPTARFLGASP